MIVGVGTALASRDASSAEPPIYPLVLSATNFNRADRPPARQLSPEEIAVLKEKKKALP